jgi:TP53 regulating kinase and related kinases
MVDASEGVIGLEWIDGSSVRKLIPGAVADGEEPKDDDESPNHQLDSSSSLDEYGVSIGNSNFSSSHQLCTEVDDIS